MIDGLVTFYSDVSGKRKNTYKKTYRFKVVNNPSKQRINLIAEDMVGNSLLTEDDAYWSYEQINDLCLNKLNNLAVVEADVLKGPEHESFKYSKLSIYKGLDRDAFIRGIEEGWIKICFRVGNYKDGRAHDHGTALRIRPNKLKELYASYASI